MTDREKAQLNSNESTVSWAPKSVPSDKDALKTISPSPLMIGLIVGAVLTIYLAAINGILDWPTAGAKVFKYILMGGFLTWALVKFERRYPAGEFFKEGLIGAGIISAVAAVVVAVGNLFFYSINPEMGFEKFVDADGSGLTAFAYSGILLFEVFVIGMIISFILLQFLKGRSKEERI